MRLGRNIERRRKVIHHRVQHGLDTFVLEGRAARSPGRLCNAMVALRMPARISSLVMSSPSMNLCISASSCSRWLSIMWARYSLRLSSIRSSGISISYVLRTERFIAPHDAAHFHQVHNAHKLFFRADRNLNRYRAALQAVYDGIDGVVEIRAHAVHLVNEANARDANTCRPAARPFPTAAARQRPRRIPLPRRPAREGCVPLPR